MSYTPPKDSNVRSTKGVAVSLSPDENGQTKVILDDIGPLPRVIANHAWEHEGLFTFENFDTAELQALATDREKLALLGENILIRLLVLNKRMSE
jgi:hypothetical protein